MCCFRETHLLHIPFLAIYFNRKDYETQKISAGSFLAEAETMPKQKTTVLDILFFETVSCSVLVSFSLGLLGKAFLVKSTRFFS